MLRYRLEDTPSLGALSSFLVFSLSLFELFPYAEEEENHFHSPERQYCGVIGYEDLLCVWRPWPRHRATFEYPRFYSSYFSTVGVPRRPLVSLSPETTLASIGLRSMDSIDFLHAAPSTISSVPCNIAQEQEVRKSQKNEKDSEISHNKNGTQLSNI